MARPHTPRRKKILRENCELLEPEIAECGSIGRTSKATKMDESSDAPTPADDELALSPEEAIERRAPEPTPPDEPISPRLSRIEQLLAAP